MLRLKPYATLSSISQLLPPIFPNFNSNSNFPVGQNHFYSRRTPKIWTGNQRISATRCGARRRVRYEEEDDEEGDEQEYGHNAEIAMLEFYSQTAKEEALLVRAIVDEQDVEVLIFKGFSSSLSYGTSPDPSKSILPARAVIKSIDRIKGPFDPSNVEYIEKGLTIEAFKSRFQP